METAVNNTEKVLKGGMVFETTNHVTIEVSQKFGAKFKVNISDLEHGFVATDVMSKAEIVKNKEISKVKTDQKLTKLSLVELAILRQISSLHDGISSKPEVDAVWTRDLEVEGLTRFQVSGHISILERKGFIDLESVKPSVKSKLKKIELSKMGEIVLGTLATV